VTLRFVFMVRLKTIQASAFRTVFEVLKDIINDVNLVFRPEGLMVVTLDTARVTLVHLVMPAENFEEYHCEGEHTAGLNVSNTYKLLKSVTNTDTLSMSIDDSYLLHIHIENAVKKSSTSFEFKLLDINDDMLSVPEIDMNVLTTIPSVDFQRVTRDMNNLAQDIRITRKKNTLELECEGGFANQKTILECVESGKDNALGNIFSLKYINMFTRATSLCSSVQLMQHEDDSDMPIVFRYTVANLGELRFYLAPKVE
jgi:proliferating cell nuclear antigen